MKNLDFFSLSTWKPLEAFGFTHPCFQINISTVVHTWIVLGILFALCIPLRAILNNPESHIRFLFLRFVQAFINLTTSAFGFFHYGHAVFIISLFLFILLANMASLLPWVEEPTKDLNTTLACAIIAFVYIQTCAIAAHGLRAYLAEYTAPFFLMAPLHVIGKLSSIVSLSFRLFGNIFGGATIIHIFGVATQGVIAWELLALPINLITSLFFVGFEGFLQAFVFTMLTTTYLALAIQPEEGQHA